MESKDYILQDRSGAEPINFRDELNDSQYEAVMFNEGPLLVIAGAGSGKTKTLVHRVARLVQEGVPPHAILLLTFTRKSSQEMLHRASQILDNRCRNVTGGTFHGFANAVLRQHASVLGYPNTFTILDRGDADDLVGSLRKKVGFRSSDKRFPQKRTIGSIISKMINTNQPIEAVIEADYPHFYEFSDDIVSISKAYVKAKKEQGVMDYDDLLVQLANLLKHSPETRAEVAASFQYIMVDEYQDTNTTQAEIITLLAQDHQNVMVVGDDAQSIYSFRGAHYQNIINFPQQFAGAKTIMLEQNYRSVQPILDLTNAVIAKATERYAKTLFTENEGTIKPVYVETGSDNEQSQFVCQKIIELQESGTPLNDIAVLFRASQHANDLEIELTRHNIPYVKYGGFKFTETAHIKDVVGFLKVIYNKKDEVNWRRILQLLDGVGAVTANKIIDRVTSAQGGTTTELLAPWQGKKYYETLASCLAVVYQQPVSKLSDLISLVIDYYKPILKQTYDDFHKRQTDLNSLLEIADQFEDLESFLSEVTLDPPESTVVDHRDEVQDCLVLSTIHSAKGLEWNSVFVLSLVDGYLPSFRSMDNVEQLEEERRLLYVALTRAKENLFLLKPHLEMGQRGGYGGGFDSTGYQFSQLSRFLNDYGFMDTYTEKWKLSRPNQSVTLPSQQRRKYYF